MGKMKLDADTKGEYLVTINTVRNEMRERMEQAAKDCRSVLGIANTIYMLDDIEGHLIESDEIESHMADLLADWADELEHEGNDTAICKEFKIRWMQEELVRVTEDVELGGEPMEVAYNAMEDIARQMR